MSAKSTIEKARAAKGQAAEVFGRLADVIGVGITRVGEGYGVKVNLRARPEGVSLPKSVAGVPVKVEVVGKVKKQ